MSKFRVKSGFHHVNGRLLRAGDTFEVKSDKFLTAERVEFFEKVEEPAKPAEEEQKSVEEEQKKRGRKPKAEAAADVPAE